MNALAETRLLIGFFLLIVFVTTSGLAHSLEAILKLARDGLVHALKFLNVTVFGHGIKLGDKIANGVVAIANPVIHELGRAAQASDAQVAKWFYGLASVAKQVFDAIEAVAMLTVSLTYWIVKGVVWPAIKDSFRAVKVTQINQAKVARDTRQHAVGAQAAQGRPLTARISHSVAAALRPAWQRIGALEHEVGVAIPNEVEWLRDRDRSLGRLYDQVFKKVKEQGKALTGIAAATLTAVALERLGASWIRCSRWKRLGRRVCGPWGSIIDDLLLGAFAFDVLVDPVEIARLADEAEALLLPVIEKVAG